MQFVRSPIGIRHLTALGLLTLALVPTPASAQSTRELEAAVRSSREGREGIRQQCSFSVASPKQWQRADLDGDGVPELVAPYVTEGCGGGNYWGLSVGVFRKDGSSWRMAGAGHVEGTIEGVQIDGRTLTVRTLAYGENDARCCPTKQAAESFVYADGALRPVKRRR